ncbi:TetR family transcriptional regulator [Tenggerimyces flavus]|uniref:TetR family transcriptional regulator n=1 Tax=Tenggerimyces flavus TaxID=1708749 RepID=A0ABV7YNM3_9ACTN|nr:TetR family transcriptional regulator [Tenggerimyces flavus]MBM7784666.1 AcrR family transcriptional regulator [Tenggerimyces flavus]
MATPSSLRERKKRQTRELIASTAFRLFAERGFDQVTVAEIARQSDVSAATVFNYFPTKEDLIYSGFEEFQRELVLAIRDRPDGTTLLEAFREYVLRPTGLLGKRTKEENEAVEASSRIIHGSGALLAREREVYDDVTRVLAEVIRKERGAKLDDIAPWTLANAMLGIHRALVEYVRRQALERGITRQLPARLRAQAEEAVEALRTLEGT